LSRVGDRDNRVGLVAPIGCTGKEMEKRFVLCAALVVVSEVAVDMVLPWLWKLNRPEEIDLVGLVGELICSTGLGFAARAPEFVSISFTSIGCTLLFLFGDTVRCGG